LYVNNKENLNSFQVKQPRDTSAKISQMWYLLTMRKQLLQKVPQQTVKTILEANVKRQRLFIETKQTYSNKNFINEKYRD
jgi:hypothetical protein